MSADTLTEQLVQFCAGNMEELCLLGETFMIRGEDAVLICLSRSEEPMLSGLLVEATGLTTGRIANILKSLERKGLVSRMPDQEDRRRVLVSLTEQGQSAVGELYRSGTQRLARLMDYLGEEDGADILRLLERCTEYFR